MLKKNLLILGAGGFGRSIAELAQMIGRWKTISFVDDIWPNKLELDGYPVLSDIHNLAGQCPQLDEYEVIAAVGNNIMRECWINQIQNAGFNLTSIVHPHAIIAPSAQIAQGSCIMAGCIVGSNTVIGKGVILNLNTLLDHDVMIEDYSHLSLGVIVKSGVRIPKASTITAGMIVNNDA